MIRRAALALVVAAMTLTGLTTGTAAAASDCGDYHWIGAAGSGPATARPWAANDGMGDVVYQSYQQRTGRPGRQRAHHHRRGRAVPGRAGAAGRRAQGWLGFLGSVGDGTRRRPRSSRRSPPSAPTPKVVLAGYSQGAMIVHRNPTTWPTTRRWSPRC